MTQYWKEFLGLMAVPSVLVLRFLASGRWFNHATGAMFIGLGLRPALQQAK